jgi:transcriptional regulator with XRE-family HTH domain
MPAATTTRHGNSFADLLRKFRKHAGLNQQQLAGYLAVSPKRISKWEKGVSKPPQDTQFYNRLRIVPGITESDITRLMEAAEASKFTEDFAKLFAQLNAHREEIWKIFDWQAGSSIEVRRQGLIGKSSTVPHGLRLPR